MLLKLATFAIGTVLYVASFSFFVIVVLLVKIGLSRFSSVSRGARQRDEILMAELKSLGPSLDDGSSTPEQIELYAAKPALRWILYQVLEEMDKKALFPPKYLTVPCAAESRLAYWLMHPNEAGQAPEEMSLLEIVKRNVGKEICDFHVFRFRTKEEPAFLGVSGPYRLGDAPYENGATAFSRFKKDETPPDLVDWFIKMRRKLKVPA